MTVFFIAFSLEEEFWLGLENIYELTQVKNYTLRVTMETFEGIIKTAFYTDFKLLDNVSNHEVLWMSEALSFDRGVPS